MKGTLLSNLVVIHLHILEVILPNKLVIIHHHQEVTLRDPREVILP